MKTVTVGVYEAGFINYELRLREGTGGNYVMAPKGFITFIELGADIEWPFVMKALFHEVEELFLRRMELGYFPSIEIACASDQMVFVMTHTQMSELTARMAQFIIEAMPDLDKAWQAWKKENKDESD